MNTNAALLLAMALLVAGSATRAAEPAEADMPRQPSTSELLMQSLLGEGSLDSSGSDAAEPATSKSGAMPADTENGESLAEYGRVAQRLRIELETAQARLAQGQIDEQTKAAQAEALAATERLIELARQAASSSSSSDSESSPPGSDSANGGGNGSATRNQESTAAESQNVASPRLEEVAGRQNREGKAEESSQRPVEKRQPGANYSTFRTTVIEHSWGHLPERMRQRLLNGGGDKTLPRYEMLVNQYFGSLVHPEEEGTTEVP